MARRSFRLPESLADRIDQAVQEDGYSSFTAFIRTAIQNELKRREQQTELTKIEHAIAAAMERQNEGNKRLATTLQAHFAFTDALARVILHYCRNLRLKCMPKHWLAPRSAMTGY
jgi:Arc/MetJ-type ribon-helix-helix transcriptional regulator